MTRSRRILRELTGLVLVAQMTGCATVTPVPTVPQRGQASEMAARDREECEAKARAEAPSGVVEFLAGKIGATVVGAGVGGLLGLQAAGQSGGNSARDDLVLVVGGVALGAALGFVAGSFLGVKKATETRQSVIDGVFRKCLRDRGYGIEL